jgi:hypothetical protein
MLIPEDENGISAVDGCAPVAKKCSINIFVWVGLKGRSVLELSTIACPFD